MADDRIEVPFDNNPSDQATLLLAAAEELGLGSRVVGTREGVFVVPQEVADKAFAAPEPEEPQPTKKAATKRTATKKKG